MSYGTVALETGGPVASVTVDRPEAYNALSKKLRGELLAALRKIEADDTARVCILKGAGRGFSAGNDLLDGSKYDHASDLIVGEYLPILETIANSDKLYIAQIQGRATGIGASIAMTCDFLTMAEDAAIYMAFAAIALIPDGGACYHLTNAMGYHRALQAIIEGCDLPAGECYALGIANKVFAPAALDAETRKWAESLTSRAPLAMSAAKRVLRSMDGMSYADVVRAEAQQQDALARSGDFDRGVEAFRNREAPVFEGN